MNSMNCITLSESFWNTLEEFQTSMWRTLVRVQSDLQDNGFFSALCPVYVRLSLSWVYITEALYKSIHVSLCRRHNGTLYIYWTREFLQYNLFNSRTCEGVQRRRGTVGLKKEHSDRDHIHGDTHKKQLFALWWWCFVANVFDQNEIESYHTESCTPKVITDVSVTLVLEFEGRRCCQSVHYFGPVKNMATHIRWIAIYFCADIHGLQRMNFNDLKSSNTILIGWIAHVHIPLRMNCNNFGDPLTSHLPPSTGLNINLSNT